MEDVKQNYGDLSRDFLTFCSVNILGIFLLDLHKLHWPIFEFLSSAMVVSLLRSKPVNVRVVLISIFVFVALLTAHEQWLLRIRGFLCSLQVLMKEGMRNLE